jgi:uncharacterized protein (DUF305 family)
LERLAPSLNGVLETPVQNIPAEPPPEGPSRRFGRDLALGALIGALLFGAIVGLNRMRNGSTKDTSPLTAVEVGFLHDMIDHHAQAVLISKAYRANNGGDAKSYADEVILFQDQEIGVMKAILTEAGQPLTRTGDQAMAWMGEPSPVATMPGMQSPEQLAELGQTRRARADTLWFTMMTDHHRGGVEMLDHVLHMSKVKRIIEMATKMRGNQSSEIIEYRQAMVRFGLAVSDAPAAPAAGSPTTTAHSH